MSKSQCNRTPTHLECLCGCMPLGEPPRRMLTLRDIVFLLSLLRRSLRREILVLNFVGHDGLGGLLREGKRLDGFVRRQTQISQDINASDLLAPQLHRWLGPDLNSRSPPNPGTALIDLMTTFKAIPSRPSRSTPQAPFHSQDRHLCELAPRARLYAAS